MSGAGPHELSTTRLIMGPDGAVTAKAVTATFYPELETEFNGFRDHVLVQDGEFAEAWPAWEMHPHGDEIVYLLSGNTDFVLRKPGGDEVLHLGEPGMAVVVPKGCWHTARPRAPTRLLFITPGEGTQHSENPSA